MKKLLFLLLITGLMLTKTDSLSADDRYYSLENKPTTTDKIIFYFVWPARWISSLGGGHWQAATYSASLDALQPNQVFGWTWRADQESYKGKDEKTGRYYSWPKQIEVQWKENGVEKSTITCIEENYMGEIHIKINADGSVTLNKAGGVIIPTRTLTSERGDSCKLDESILEA